ncbi:MutS-related protein [Pseudobacter ginsenosidimutans]|uniref:MutS-like protein n=1 Tax=Pseudobacter ginsenosidimutans TaxID=661488 RepID=A0A4Q7N383_9BACT|nr:DNA mismatch repair protein [Pseudobacter ginsenosidimutans]QEC43345.1 DNA mismatch repair protein [Pseudobacter ginsenosidimutans]RZS74708.1 MutS-like protein [Pseudobacter ginsenosidimutans]
MNLITDEQTIGDIRIFGKREEGGIYDLYNQTHTRGGQVVLEQMFRSPLSDKKMINERSSIISCFAQKNILFPFEAALFDMAEKYLVTDDQGKQAGTQSVLSEKDVANGVMAVIELMQLIRSFVERTEVLANEAWQPERIGILELLTDGAFEPVYREKAKARIAYGAVTAYDQLFRVREKAKIERLLALIYNLDVYLSVAGVARERKFVFAKAMEKGGAILKVKDVYHPGLTNPVANDISLHPEKNLIFLTGANMAGKSTFLRSLSTALYVAHMGFPVAAGAMEFSVMDGIYTTVNLPDNLGIGASHFYAEVLRVKKVAAELAMGKSLFIVFDELFRGTNVKDAHEATVAVSLAFARKKNSLFIISSHIVEAGEQLSMHPSVGFQYLPTRMEGITPEYTYKLEAGITADRHGMIIIRNEGILDTLKNGHKRTV